MSQENLKNSEKLPFLLEIGSEEIPARFIPGAMEHFEKTTVKALESNYLSWDSLRIVATPRRMALLVEGLSVRQPDRNVEIKGPPVSVAFDADGNPTPAAIGFSKKAGLDITECGRGQDKRGEFLLAKRVEPGKSAAEVLQDLMPSIILGIPFRKTMKWGSYDLDYARPLQWLVALLGDEVVDMKVDYLKSGRQTRGHRTLSSDKEVSLQNPGEYFVKLKEAGVIADHKERREIISKGLLEVISGHDSEAKLLDDQELLTEVVFLCEYPTPFLGTFGDEYLDLPAEVVTTAMRSHQKYFSVEKNDSTGLKPCFAAVRCGGNNYLANVVAGNEKVLHARLNDALFYWNFDQKKSPDERTEMLGSVTWMENFGSVLDKTKRLAGLSVWLWDHGWSGSPEEKAALERAAVICKSDLVSEMIKDGKEFTKLEGFIGARYAELAGESTAVCRAIEQHFLPRSATGALPDDKVSSLLSVADRLDNVAGCWLAGFVPTGAKDPYALRRHVLAVLRILLANSVHINLEQALQKALSQVAAYGQDADIAETQKQINEFVVTRLTGYFTEGQGQDPDVVRAVIPVRWRDPADALEWVKSLNNFRDREDFQLLATGFKRCRNILKGDVLPVEELDSCLQRWCNGGSGALGEDFDDMPEDVEQSLRQQAVKAAEGIRDAEVNHNYDGVFSLLSGMGPAIDRYFEEVRVNAEEKDLRILRHSFLREIYGLFARYADFAAVAPSEG
ncbi:MAG: glycine--tRNA ligase subunit beta [bacterium]|nr:glycine--tRNA ligase subunit beta [bacterium]